MVEVVLLKVYVWCSNEHIQLVDHHPIWRSIYIENSGKKVSDRGRRRKLLADYLEAPVPRRVRVYREAERDLPSARQIAIECRYYNTIVMC